MFFQHPAPGSLTSCDFVEELVRGTRRMNTGDRVDVPAARKVSVKDSFPLFNRSLGVVAPVAEDQASYVDFRMTVVVALHLMVPLQCESVRGWHLKQAQFTGRTAAFDRAGLWCIYVAFRMAGLPTGPVLRTAELPTGTRPDSPSGTCSIGEPEYGRGCELQMEWAR